MKIALIIGLAPRKLGSLEEWLVEFAAQSQERGHAIDVFSREPILPTVKETLHRHGAGWIPVRELRERPVRSVRRLRRYHVIFVHLFGMTNRVAQLALAAWPARVVYVDHFSRRDRSESTLARIRRFLLRRIASRRIAAAVGVSEFTRRHLSELLGLDVSRTHTVHNGVNIERFHPESSVGSPSRRGSAEPVHVLAVSNLIPEKGIDVLLRAAARVEGIHLRVIGDGPQLGGLRRLTRELGIEGRTEFLGLRSDVDRYLSECDVFVHPAVWTEAFGLTIAEAMASGRAVIASRVGAIPELIEDHRSGRLVPPADPDALAAALAELAARPELRSRLGHEARERAVAMFDLRRCVTRHLELAELVARS